MEHEAYKRQVALLLSIIPEVAKETCFALHGGTAINLFIRDMPRLSVDIDLTYILLEDRDTSLGNIAAALERIKARIENVISGVRINPRIDIGKLQISLRGADVKIEVNLVKRGVLNDPIKMALCKKAQDEFEVFCAISGVPLGQLYGGKICAALDRQHPRDLFDVKYLLANEGFTEDIKTGFLLNLLCGDRPINEILYPNLKDQRAAMANQFEGMSAEDFSYEEYEIVRAKLIETVNESLTEADKTFLLSVKDAQPDWTIYDFERFPAVAWKLQNLQKLKASNPTKHREQYLALERKLRAND